MAPIGKRFALDPDGSFVCIRRYHGPEVQTEKGLARHVEPMGDPIQCQSYRVVLFDRYHRGPERTIALEPLCKHAGQFGYLVIAVVKDAHFFLSRMKSMEPSDVLFDSTFPGYRQSQE